MKQANSRARLGTRGLVLLGMLFGGLLCPTRGWCQLNAGEGIEIRGNRAEIVVTVHDSSGALISAAATVKLFHGGTPYDQGSTSKGRVFFMLHSLGDFTVVVEAAGYKPVQKDVTMTMAIKTEVDINLQLDSNANFTAGAAGDPILAPKAKESLEKGLQALRDDKLDEAEKSLGEAMKLAPNNPQVLYVMGVLDLKKKEWLKAQTVLEKATQIEPTNARALSALGMALCNQKKYAEAIVPLEKSVELDPASGWETHWSLAQSYYHSERYEEALKVSQQAQEESNGQAPQVDLLLAQSLVAVGRYEESAQVLRELLKNHADGPEASTARRFLAKLAADGKIKGQ
jgi:Flp pilus assembly protein TadD